MANKDLVRATLTDARNRILDPEEWVRHSQAETIDGMPVGADHPEAAKWCALGSLERSASLFGGLERNSLESECEYYLVRALEEGEVQSKLMGEGYNSDIAWFNDMVARNNSDVVALYEEAIEFVD